MDPVTFTVVLCAAVLHAVWNSMVKGGADKVLAMAGVVLGHVPIALAILPFVALPAVESLPWILAGMLLHTGYEIFLVQSYKFGDLSVVYPVARGTAPLWVTLISLLAFGVVLTTGELLAIGLIGLGIVLIAFARGRDGLGNGKSVALALATGGFIAAYSLTDGTGARLSGSPLGYYAILALGNAAIFAAYLRYAHPGTIRRLGGEGRKVYWLGGGASFLAYSMVMWAFTRAPIALVTALRETSIIVAVLIGVVFFKEPLGHMKGAALALAFAGVLLLRLT